MDLCFGVLPITRRCYNRSRHFQEFFRRVCSGRHDLNGQESLLHLREFRGCQLLATISMSMQLGERLSTQTLAWRFGPHPWSRDIRKSFASQLYMLFCKFCIQMVCNCYLNHSVQFQILRCIVPNSALWPSANNRFQARFHHWFQIYFESSSSILACRCRDSRSSAVQIQRRGAQKPMCHFHLVPDCCVAHVNIRGSQKVCNGSMSKIMTYNSWLLVFAGS